MLVPQGPPDCPAPPARTLKTVRATEPDPLSAATDSLAVRLIQERGGARLSEPGGPVPEDVGIHVTAQLNAQSLAGSDAVLRCTQPRRERLASRQLRPGDSTDRVPVPYEPPAHARNRPVLLLASVGMSGLLMRRRSSLAGRLLAAAAEAEKHEPQDHAFGQPLLHL